MKQTIFVGSMKLSDILAANYHLFLMLPRLGIELGFGDKTVEQVCKTHHVPVSFFLLVCNVHAFDEYLPDNQTILQTDMSKLVEYLSFSHHFYIEERLPPIETTLHKITEACQAQYGTILKRFFEEYKNELICHFHFEEEKVFPYIERVRNGHLDDTFNIETYQANHSNVEDKLSDLTNIITKYLSANILQKERIRILFDIFEFSNDLHKHSLIEDKVLVPYVKSLEALIHE
ncbi:MAG: hemerythrin domain-containing protein [Bacteroidales bacterium]|jgi:regulator of cell morphogenesis and NO signaling|nr:hemerythrin domain-containing protein [Bacteroidales bacterium]